MNIIDTAESDLSFILEDKNNGFGVQVVLISLTGVRYGENDELIGQTTDIGFRIDPQTGTLIVGRTAEINLRESTVLNVIGSLPKKGWKAEITHSKTDNVKWTFVLREGIANDRQLGVIKLPLNLVEKTP
jgi:hypothetical protein